MIRTIPSSLTILSGLTILALAGRVEAQVVQGAVLDATSGRPVGAAMVELVDSMGGAVASAHTGTRGLFMLRAPSPGRYRVRARSIGYADFTSDPFAISEAQEAWAEVRLGVSPVPVEPLEAVAEGRVEELQKVGFYRRLHQGTGLFLQREEIEEKKASLVTELLYGLPGVRVFPTDAASGEYDVIMRGARTRRLVNAGAQAEKGAPCFPTVVLDGLVVRRGGYGDARTMETGRWNELVPPAQVEAIEVYPSGNGLPVQYGGMTSPCGAILIWTRWR